MFLFPLPQFYYFPSSFSNSLPLHNINLSPPPPHSFFILLLLHNFYYFPSSMLLFPRPQFYYFSSFLNSLPLHNINLSSPPPHSCFSSFFTIFIISPPSILISLLLRNFIISLLHLHLLVYSIYFSIHKYIDLLSTLHRPHINPRLNFFSTQLSK